MNHSMLKTILLVVLVAIVSAGGGYWLAHRGMSGNDMMNDGKAAIVATPDKKQALYWYDPMVPSQHFDKPGKSPFMDMQLVPKYTDAGGGNNDGGIKIDSTLTQNIGIRLATAERGTLSQSLEAPASVTFNEREVAVVQTRTSGFVERVYARAPGDVIRQGAPLLDILVPEWAGAQTEFLTLQKSGDADLARAARERLRLLGMPETTIQAVEKSGKPQALFTVTAPIAGVIQSLDIRQGMTISSGMTVARINGLSTMWMEAAVPEALGTPVTMGKAVSAQLAAYPGKSFEGRVIAVLPEVNTQTRTLRVRMEFPNRGDLLRPGMFAQVQLSAGHSPEAILVPAEAVIRTGKRNVIIVAEANGSFRPAEVSVGTQANGKIAIFSGVAAGEKVVASGQFLIDSEASFQGVLARMNTASHTQTQGPAVSPQEIVAHGVIEAVNAKDITLSHEPIPALDWPAMTMAFPLASGINTAVLKKGQRVQFTLEKRGDELVIVRIGNAEGM